MTSDTNPKRPIRLLTEVAEGRVASAIFGSGFLDHCLGLGAEVTVLTPAASYQPFLDRYKTPGVTFERIPFDTTVSGAGRLVGWERRIGRRLIRAGMLRTRRRLWENIGARLAVKDAGPMLTLLDASPPDAFVSLDVNMGFGRGFVGACRRRGIPTVGNMFSWDHPFYEHPSRPDRIACWSEFTKSYLLSRSGFMEEQVEITGAPAYDAYVNPENEWSREELCQRLGLDSRRPILVFASLGQFAKYMDETDTFGALLEEIDAGRIPGEPQIVLRLHPVSREQYWHRFSDRQDVVWSRYIESLPGMRWWPSPDEVAEAANLLRHADVVLSPGSTMAIEPAIFDTPTIVPIFNRYMPEEFDRFFDQFWMSRHFAFLADNNLVPMVRSVGEMTEAICQALADRGWMRSERGVIRDQVLGPLDGRAAERLAHAAVEAAGKRPKRNKETQRRKGAKTQRTAND